jgi:glycolate oxidase
VLSTAVTRDLKGFLGDQAVSSTLEDRTCYSFDAVTLGCLPDLVVFPANQADVIRLMRYAHRGGIPVIPRGAGSGCSGGGVSARGGILASFERMNRILSLDRELMLGQVEPGVVTAHFQREAERCGLFYPPDPSSAEISTLGGNVAHGAGGLRGRKYGTTKDYVLGLEAVLVDGQLVRTGFFSPGQSGDLTGLLVGSEGTLAIITKIALRLAPRPESFSTQLFVFPRVSQIIKTAHSILGAGLVPAVMEFMDQRAVECVRAHGQAALPQVDGHILLVELTGRRQEVLSGAEQVERLGRDGGALVARRATTASDREKIWSVRRALSPSMAYAAAQKVSQDVCVPPKALIHLLKEVDRIGQKYQLSVITFGHLGDGNLHVNLMSDGSRELMRQTELAVGDLFRAVLALGGTLSGEHGVGLAKARYLSWEFSSQTMGAHRKIKAAFDPREMLNPNKMFSTSDMSTSPDLEGKNPSGKRAKE